MDIATTLSASDKASLNMQVDAFNTALSGTKEVQQSLDKDDFMKILITQLQNQDPTEPMEDKEFIAQMAQFSSLEQMTNMSSQFTELTTTLKAAQALNLIGKEVELASGEQIVQGRVEAVTGGAFPQMLVNGAYYDYDDITKVSE